MRSRLSVLMFLQWAVPASLVPLYSVHLEKRLGFDEMTTALCCATQAVASVLSSLIAGQVADRWLSAERAMAVCATLAGADLWLLAGLTGPAEVFAATLVFWALTGPMLLMGTTIAFVHLERPDQEFGPVRMWGTVGWLAMGWVVGSWFGLVRGGEDGGPLADAFRVGGVTAFVLAAYTATLPRTPPREAPVGSASYLAPLQAMRLLRRGPFAAYCVCALGLCITFPFTTQSTPLLLRQLGVGDRWLGPTMTIAQTTEILTLGLLPALLPRLGVRGAMTAGLVAWLGAMVVQAAGGPLWLVVASLGLNGLYVTGFLIAGQVYVNSLATDGVRASAQGLFSFVNGLGLLLGNLLAGRLREAGGGELRGTFLVGAGITAAMLVVFLAGFRQPGARSAR